MCVTVRRLIPNTCANMFLLTPLIKHARTAHLSAKVSLASNFPASARSSDGFNDWKNSLFTSFIFVRSPLFELLAGGDPGSSASIVCCAESCGCNYEGVNPSSDESESFSHPGMSTHGLTSKGSLWNQLYGGGWDRSLFGLCSSTCLSMSLRDAKTCPQVHFRVTIGPFLTT